jgi:hypothetical protein
MLERVHILTVLALVFLALPSAIAQDDPYAKDGERGAIPEGTESSDIGKTFRIDAPPSNPLSCDKTYFTRGTAQETVKNCEGFNFESLYEQASNAAYARAEKMKCKEGAESECKTLKTWRAWHSWDCTGTTAGAVVVYGAECPKTLTGFKGSPLVKPPKASELKEPNSNSATQPGTTESIDLTGGTGVIACKPPKVVAYHYQVGEASKPASMKTYVEEAETQAKAYDHRLKCAEGCKKQDFKPAKVTWKWDGTHVVVDVYFVACKP